MKNMKSMIFDHWRHRGYPFEGHLSKIESNLEDSNFPFKSVFEKTFSGNCFFVEDAN